ncbi:hypothetical protein SLEP1_g37817 [Rubroshorea leprosula]|uniref:Alkyl transferase n=1 Tax=Rubroshorea leprosula TaxID=152421 RepID=A0AAV5KVW0_9ROSI|nr:hypothetical protein SLEP1_g37817 [Rubroshorea leprosula]
METEAESVPALLKLLRILVYFLRKLLWRVLSVGAIPKHIAFIVDGNRTYAKKKNLDDEASYRAAFTALLFICKYCSELGVKHLTFFAFSIDNFRRTPQQIKCVMDLLLEKTQLLLKEENLVKKYGVRVIFVGNLQLLNEPLRLAAEKAMAATAGNSKIIISVCVAYKSSNEIVCAIQKSCKHQLNAESCALKMPKMRPSKSIKLVHLQKYLSMSVVPNPNILIRTSGETRLSDFLLWQTTNCLLYSPAALWPEIGLRHLVWAILNYQRLYPYLERKKDQV